MVPLQPDLLPIEGSSSHAPQFDEAAFDLTVHAQRRIAQRSIPEPAISLILEFADAVWIGDVQVYVLRRKDLRRAGQQIARGLDGATLILQGARVITAYRCPKRFDQVARWRRVRWRTPEPARSVMSGRAA